MVLKIVSSTCVGPSGILVFFGLAAASSIDAIVAKHTPIGKGRGERSSVFASQSKSGEFLCDWSYASDFLRVCLYMSLRRWSTSSSTLRRFSFASLTVFVLTG